MTRTKFIAIRKAADLTQTDLAKLLGVTRSTVARYEGGQLLITSLVEFYMNTLKKGQHNE